MAARCAPASATKKFVRLRFEPLEDRIYLHGMSLDTHDTVDGLISIRAHLASWAATELRSEFQSDFVPEFGMVPASLSQGATATPLAGQTYSLSSVPALNSLPGAHASLYLDFNGDFESTWGTYSNVTAPAYDQDGDPTTFSDGELASIQAIWQQVSEDYSPFNINVTTVEPSSFANGVAERIAIGGDGAWTGGRYGGVSYTNSFTSNVVNVSYVFSQNLSSGFAKYTAEAVSHEAGHAFGLQHQSLYDANGNFVATYYTGPGDGTAPIMGNSYNATRGLWWYGTTTSSISYQDDMLLISRSTNGFGYRPDDHGNAVVNATALAVNGNQLSGSGIIEQTSDVDYFSFRTDAGQINLWTQVPGGINDLDARLELRDSTGTLIASADPSDSFGASITTTVAAGTYYLVVGSHGHYGDVGQYTVGGTILAPAGGTVINTPTNLTATAVSGQIALTWTDNATNETCYNVARSVDGVNWTIVATLAANSTSFTDVNVVAGGTYFYRVSAGGVTQSSDYSNQAQATLAPQSPVGLTATAVSSKQVNVAWNDVAGESGFKVQRSTDGGATWTVIATVGATVTSYQNTGLAPSTTYLYRVVAFNAGGDSLASAAASATTQAAPVAPVAPSGLAATSVASRQVALKWTDNSLNETGFTVERSSNGGKSWSIVGTVSADATSFTDTSVSGRKTYTYRVRAFNDGGNSAYSNLLKVTTPR